MGSLNNTTWNDPHDRSLSGTEPPQPCISRLPTALRIYVAILVTALVATALNLARLYKAGGNPLRARLWSEPSDRFGDFWHYQALFPYLHTTAFFSARERFAYPAPCAIVYQVLYSLGPYKHLIFDLGLWSVELASALLLVWLWIRNGLCARLAVPVVLLLTLGSHPWHLLYERGNLEIFLYILIAAGLCAFLSGRFHFAAALWGVAAAMKLYPVILLGVFLRRARATALLTGLATCAAVLLGSFLYVGPTVAIAFQGMLHGLQGFQDSYGGVVRRNELYADHSLLGSVKQLLDVASNSHDRAIPTVQRAYELAVIVGVPLFWWFRVRRLALVNQLCVFLLLMVLLPTVSYDYTLVHSYLVFGVISIAYITAVRDGRPFRHAAAYFVAFAVLAIPITWVHIGPLDLNGLLKCAALIGLIVLLSAPDSDFSQVAPGTIRQPIFRRPSACDLQCAAVLRASL